jgi:outer membrane protein OmpA-like peptidoglycan-associated protein
MGAAFGVRCTLAAISLFVVAPSASAEDEKLMSTNPSQCEVFTALSGDASCEPSAGREQIDGSTQGLTVVPPPEGDSGTDPTETKQGSKIAAKPADNSPSSGPRAAAFQSIQFEFNSADLTTAARETLDTVAAVLEKPLFASSKFVIEGHTDGKGSAEYNLALSERRAQAVVHYLVQHGVAADQLSARGMGESKPFDKSDPNAAVNRRVVVLNLGG